MKKEDIFVVLGIAGIIGFFVLIYFSMKTPAITEQSTAPTIQPTEAQQMPQDGNFNPDYGNLTEDQIKIADIAIGKLLNASQGITPPMISVIHFEKHNFKDSSLDCPQEGKTYTQGIIPGYHVMLLAQGKTYDYRLTDEKNIIQCKQ